MFIDDDGNDDEDLSSRIYMFVELNFFGSVPIKEF